jgi:hypothetical protein
MGKETPIICGIQFDVLFRKFPASPAEWPHGEVQGCVQYNFIFRHDPRVIFRYVLAYTQYGVLSRSFSNSGHRKCSDVEVPAIGVDWSHRSVGAHLRTYWGSCLTEVLRHCSLLRTWFGDVLGVCLVVLMLISGTGSAPLSPVGLLCERVGRQLARYLATPPCRFARE